MRAVQNYVEGRDCIAETVPLRLPQAIAHRTPGLALSPNCHFGAWCFQVFVSGARVTSSDLRAVQNYVEGRDCIAGPGLFPPAFVVHLNASTRTPNPKPQTPSPKPQTSNSKPCTLHAKP